MINNREFLIYKVWDKKQKKMFEVDIYTFLLGSGLGHKAINLWKTYDVVDEWLVWRRYSGFKDIHGNKIYEGDICRIMIGEIVDIMNSVIICDNNGQFLFQSYPMFAGEKLEIMGNIYEDSNI